MPGALGQQQQVQSINQRTQSIAQNADQNQNGESQPDQAPSQPDQTQSNNSDKLSGQVFGGGPIVGVASTSKAQSIREFNHKNHYNQWQFIYDPSSDRGGLLNTDRKSVV